MPKKMLEDHALEVWKKCGATDQPITSICNALADLMAEAAQEAKQEEQKRCEEIVIAAYNAALNQKIEAKDSVVWIKDMVLSGGSARCFTAAQAESNNKDATPYLYFDSTDRQFYVMKAGAKEFSVKAASVEQAYKDSNRPVPGRCTCQGFFIAPRCPIHGM